MNIPGEVWETIFMHVSSIEWQKIHVTCSKLHFILCNSSKILQRERFKITESTIANYSKRNVNINDVIRNTKRKYLNIAFCSCSVNSFYSWVDYGHLIRYIKLKNVTFCEKIVEFLQNCINLTTIVFHSITDSDTINALHSVVQNENLVIENITSVEFNDCSSAFITDSFFTKIMKTFSSTRNLSFRNVNINFNERITSRFYLGQNTTKFDSNQIFTFDCIFNHIIKHGSVIKTLSLDNVCCIGISNNWLTQFNRITKISNFKLSLSNHRLTTVQQQKLQRSISKYPSVIRLLVDSRNFIVETKHMPVVHSREENEHHRACETLCHNS